MTTTTSSHAASAARRSYALGAVLALGTALVLVWMAGALGIIGSGGAPDRIYLVVLGTGLVGSLVARLRARGMAWAMAATSAAAVVVGLVALLRGDADLPGASVAEILGLTLFFAVPWAVSAWFFLRSAEWSRPTREGPVA